MTNKFFLIRVSLADGTRTVTDLTDQKAAGEIARFAEMLYSHHTQGPMKPMSAGHVVDTSPADGKTLKLLGVQFQIEA